MRKISVSLDSIYKAFLVSAVIGVGISYSKLYLFHMFMVLLLFSVSFLFIKKGSVRVVKAYNRSYLIFFYIFTHYALSILWSINTGYSIRYMFYIFCGVTISLSIFYYSNTVNKLNVTFKYLAIPFIIETILSILEALKVFRWPISPFSPYVKYFSREFTIDMSNKEEVVAYLLHSPTGFQWNPNNLAATLTIIAPFFLFLENKRYKYSGLLVIIYCVVMTGSRGNFLAILLMFFLYFFGLNIKKTVYSTLVLLPVLGLFTLNIENLKQSENKKVKEMAQSFDILEKYLFDDFGKKSDSIGKRQKLMKVAWNGFVDSHGLGVGGGASIALQENARSSLKSTVKSLHNFWLEVLVDAGLFFFIIFVIWYSYVVLKLKSISRKTNHKEIKYYSSSLYLSMTAFVIAAVSTSSSIYLFPMWIMFGFATAVININNKIQRHENINTI